MGLTGHKDACDNVYEVILSASAWDPSSSFSQRRGQFLSGGQRMYGEGEVCAL